jgi:TonB family protein
MDPASITAGNLLRAFGQMLALVAATDLSLRLLRVASPRLRLAAWRTTLALCLCVPAASMRVVHSVPADLPSITLRIDSASSGAFAAILARLWLVRTEQVLLAISAWLPLLWLAGIIVRTVWLGLGLLRLTRLRADSRSLDRTTAASLGLDTLRQTLAPRADIRRHDTISQPVAFGLRHPIVLLPRRLDDLPRDAQRAIICHELLHVARHDWAWTLIDEALRATLWWHPAIWWALAQIQLHREQTIDAQVVALTASRQPYMRALLAFADAAPPLAPVVPFLRRRHLAARLQQLVQEVPMSRVRLTVTTVALTAILAGASWASLAALPLQTADAATDRPVEASKVDKRPHVIHEVKPVYPPEAMPSRGEVELEVEVARDGTVANTRVIKSSPLFDQAATDAVRQWKFEPSTIKGKPVAVLCKITVRFWTK